MANVPDTPENLEHCVCPDCPSVPKEGALYCARGRSQQPVRRRGCICGDCRVFQEYGLGDYYYCAEDSAKE
jgi:methylamine---glutamate N-methyltransferase subunit C